MKSWMVAGVALVLASIMAFGTLSSPRVARATPFLVNSTEDAVDAVPGDGICATLTGVCTLRAAIMEANMLPGTDTITIPAGIYKLTIPGSNEDRSATGDLDVSDAILVGAGSTRTIIDAGGLDRVFDAGGVQISGLTMQNGVAGNDGGGVIRGGSFTLIDVVVRGGTLPGGNTIATGAGIKASGSLTL